MLNLPDYTLKEALYHGSAFTIYKGHRNRDRTSVIVKTNASDFPAPRDLAALRHEYALLRDLHGEGVVAVLALERAGQRLALVMSDVGGRSLDRLPDRLPGRPLSIALALRIAVGVASILERVHKQNVVHKDVKPHNVIVTEEPFCIYLIDWGIATRVGEATGEVPDAQGSTTPIEGTPAYLAPEQTGLINYSVDTRADLYALGVMLYEFVTGALPFPGKGLADIIHGHVALPPKPPHIIDSQVPRPLSDIIVKLIAKSPDDRYQSAHGLIADLQNCLTQWEKSGQIPVFPIGKQDASGRFRLPQKLYGREGEVDALIAALRRVKAGAAELFLITGHGGIGKSMVVREARASMTVSGALFAAGKSEQFRSAVPYSLFVQAFRELMRQILAKPRAALTHYRAELNKALDQNARVLSDLVPELARLLGPQPPVPVLEPKASESRFHMVAQKFVQVFARRDHPLVLFLDDLQWSDLASLSLLEKLLTDPDRAHLLIIGAYRGNEVDAAHPMMRTHDSLTKAGGTVCRIELAQLSPGNVLQLLVDALNTTTAAAYPLGTELHRKTLGNPFFLGQLLAALVQDGLIYWDRERSAWAWDLPAITRRPATDHAGELLADRLQRLPPQTLELLKLGACIGMDFDHATLCLLAGQRIAVCAQGLASALGEGFIVPLADDYRLLREVDESDGAAPAHRGESGAPDERDSAASALEMAARVSYRFLHDRLQEAAYKLVGEEERRRTHLLIARHLRARQPPPLAGSELFTLVDHLNISLPLLGGARERREAIELNLQAGLAANAATAYESARRYFETAVELLGEQGFATDFTTCFLAHRERAQATFLSGDLARAETLFEELIARARTPLEQVSIHTLRIELATAAVGFRDAVRIGLVALACLGHPLPETSEAYQAALLEDMKFVSARLDAHSDDELLAAPQLKDETLLAAQRILFLLDAISFAVSADLSALISLRQLRLSLAHGMSELSASGFAAYGLTILRLSGQGPVTRRMIRVATALYARYPSVAVAIRLHLQIANAATAVSSLTEAGAHYRRAQELSIQYGDASLLVWSMMFEVFVRLALEDELEAFEALCELTRKTVERTKRQALFGGIRWYRSLAASLRGLTSTPLSMTYGNANEEEMLALLQDGLRTKENEPIIIPYYHSKLILLYLYGKHEEARPILAEAGRIPSVAGQFVSVQFAYYVCLHALALLDAGSRDADSLRALLNEQHQKITFWRGLYDTNWRCRDLLIQAERSRIEGRLSDAEVLYEEAIDAAQKDGFIATFALANELLGAFCYTHNRKRSARFCLNEAYKAWSSWGAKAKAAALLAKYPELITPPEAAPKPAATLRRTGSGATVALDFILSDLDEAMHAAHDITSEIVVDKVVEKFLRTACVFAGSQRGYVLLCQDGGLTIAGRMLASSGEVQLVPGSPLAGDGSELPESIVRYVTQSNDSVILKDLGNESHFADDPYIRNHRPKSLLCIPLIHHEQTLGAFYTDNSAVSIGLRRGSSDLLKLLAAQAASALANARLYEQLAATTQELRHSNERLEELVHSRTAELASANERLHGELADRTRVEQERSLLQEQIIQLQRSALLEMSTPLIPISDQILVMPLIGTMDEARADQMLTTALSGVCEHRAQTLIIDVTGLRQVDATAARALLQAVNALRLLGAHAILSGLRPHMVQTLVAMDVDLSSITACATLSAGIESVINRKRRL